MSDEAKKKVHLPRWSDDFPIQWDDDHYVSRRELAKFLTLGSALLVGANAAIAIAGRNRKVKATQPMRIASASTLRPGQSMLFRYPTGEDPCILVRTKAGELVAFSQVCTHLSCAVVYREEDDRLFCPCHDGVFECHGGHGGAVPVAGPPERPLPRVVLEQRGEEVYAVGIET